MATEASSTPQAEPLRVGICICTYQRPKALARLIEGLSQLSFHGLPAKLHIFVVDNDAQGSASRVCDEARRNCSWPLTYVVEPRRGIAYARNRAVESVGPEFDSIVFIDDDEVPQPQWIDELLSVRQRYDADVVGGPVLPRFEQLVPHWILRGRFFDRRRYATGSGLTHVGTGNVLIRRAVMTGMDKLFDERLALTGGEDRHFFRRVALAGFKIVWADDAVVYEWNPPSRVCFRWLVRRAFRTGNTMTLTERDVNPFWFTPVVLTAKGMVWLMLGLLLAPWGLVAGRHVSVKGVRFMAYGAGMLLGLLGTRYEEYRETHGA